MLGGCEEKKSRNFDSLGSWWFWVFVQSWVLLFNLTAFGSENLALGRPKVFVGLSVFLEINYY